MGPKRQGHTTTTTTTTITKNLTLEREKREERSVKKMSERKGDFRCWGVMGII